MEWRRSRVVLLQRMIDAQNELALRVFGVLASIFVY